MKTPTSVLLVCLGNICRSPSAQAVLTAKAKRMGLDIKFDSAGTANYHVGCAPDKRAIDTGKHLGYDLSVLRARQVTLQDFYTFDVIFAMDNHNFHSLQQLSTQAKLARPDTMAQLLLFDKQSVADPYYGDMDDFLAMFEHIQTASDYWLTLWQSSSQA